MQNQNQQQNFCSFSHITYNNNQQPSILSTHRALRTMEGYGTCTDTTCIAYASQNCPNGYTKTGSSSMLSGRNCRHNSTGAETELCSTNGKTYRNCSGWTKCC